MLGETDMSTPVTRGELRAELELFERRLDEKLESRLAHLSTRKELEIWGGALLARIEAGERRMDALEQRVIAEIARHTKAFAESMSTLVSAVDEKYADLPPRMKRLENRVFARKRR